MKLSTKLTALAALALGATACGYPTVVGTWRAAGQPITYLGASTNVESTLVFTGATPGETMRGTFTEDSALSFPATGCVLRVNAQGTWTDTAQSYGAAYTGGSIAQAGCADATQNFDLRPMTPAEVADTNARLGGTATLTSTRLTFRQFGQELTYARQL